MKKFNVFHWLAAVVVVAALAVAARGAPNDVMGDDSGTEPHFYGESGFDHLFDPWGRGHDFALRHDDGGRFVVAVSIATTVFSTATVSSPISDSSGLATLMIGIPSTTTTTDILTIILIMTSGRFTMTGIRAISPWWYKPNLHGAATIAGRSMA